MDVSGLYVGEAVGEALFNSDGDFSGTGLDLPVGNERVNWLARRTRWKTECLLPAGELGEF